VTGTCQMAFRLFTALSDGALSGSPITTSVPVSSGLFTISLNFGSGLFKGDARWLDIRVKCPPDLGFTTLSPRQPLTLTPYALALPGLYTLMNANSP